jgi:hypothetical protein
MQRLENSSKIPEACARFLSAVSDLVSGEAPPTVVAEADAHALSCTQCATELATAMDIETRLSSMPDLDPPARMWDDLQPRLDEIDREPAGTRSPVRRLVPRLVRSPARS